jgi:hypothetical protein
VKLEAWAVDPEVYAKISAHLKPPETTLWCGRPARTRPSAISALLFLWVVVTAVFGAWLSEDNPCLKWREAMGWRDWFMHSCSRYGPISWHQAEALIVLAAAFLLWSGIAQFRRLSRTCCAVTDQRLVALFEGPVEALTSIALYDVGLFSSRIRCSSWLGAIYLGGLPADPPWPGGKIPRGSVWYVDDARAVYQIIMGAAPPAT